MLASHNLAKYELEFRSITIKNGKLKIVTESFKDISYEFTGEFLVKGNFYTLDPEAKVLKGELVKKQNGKIIAQSQIVFGWGIEFDCSC